MKRSFENWWLDKGGKAFLVCGNVLLMGAILIFVRLPFVERTGVMAMASVCYSGSIIFTTIFGIPLVNWFSKRNGAANTH